MSVVSLEPVTRVWPSSERARQLTTSVWARSDWSERPSASCVVLSEWSQYPQEKSSRPSAEAAKRVVAWRWSSAKGTPKVRRGARAASMWNGGAAPASSGAWGVQRWHEARLPGEAAGRRQAGVGAAREEGDTLRVGPRRRWRAGRQPR